MIKATPHKACAEDAPTDFSVRLYRNSEGILSYVKGFLCKMTGNMSADSVQSRQVGFVRCCLNVMPGKDKPELSGKHLILTALTNQKWDHSGRLLIRVSRYFWIASASAFVMPLPLRLTSPLSSP